MPAALTHYIFSRDLVKNDKYKDIFLLGCQGPDTLFFYGYNIKKREDKDFGVLFEKIWRELTHD